MLTISLSPEDQIRVRGQLDHMRTGGCFNDAEIVVNNHRICGHKLVLAAYSGYLRQELWANDTVTLDHLDYGAVARLVDYFYTNRLQLQMAEAKAMLEAVMNLEVDSLQQVVAKHIEDNLDAGNCIEWFLISNEMGVSSITSKARRIMAREFSHVVHTQPFLELEYKELMAYLRENDAHCDEALQAAFRWMAYDAPRRDAVHDFLENLSLNDCSPTILKYIMENYEEFIADNRSMRAMNTALISHIPALRP